jgi:hypothetical protein
MRKYLEKKGKDNVIGRRKKCDNKIKMKMKIRRIYKFSTTKKFI